MLPISEVHFAFCGIATVAATLSYACARRAVLSLASPNEPSTADVEARSSEERSLKRKLDDSDEHDTDADEQSRPMKRNRTPPVELHESDEDFDQEWEVVVAPPPYEQITGLRQPEFEPVQDKSTPPQVDSHAIEQDDTPVREPTPSATSSQPEEKGVEAARCSTPQPPQVNLSPNEPDTPPARPTTPPKPTVPAKIDPVNAFSAFSGSSSPFSSYSNASGVSPFTPPGRVVKTAPAWRRGNESESGAFGRASSANALALSPNDAVASTMTKSPAPSQSKSVLGEMKSLVKSSNCLTGEEDETVEAELKGVKLFVKRGRKEFTDGMYGHVKILTQKSTPRNTGNEDPLGTQAETKSRARLLFRRDPLGQVSMNIGLHPTIRCHFDTAENILRVILMQQVATDGKDSTEDVVIYALKSGRAQKADFQSFAEMLCDHEALQSRVVVGPAGAASTTGVTTAS
ncbi:hypothetical protein HD554DRAFT_1244014 [Boletus coccyginus]|nr:hypothetical protein HD554DRAFT_1244014 [Boletus coccyginus]